MDLGLTSAASTDLRARAQARLLHIQRSNDARYKQHPWPFVKECAFTIDQVRGGWSGDDAEATGRVLPLVSDPGDEPYLRHLTDQWLKYPLVVIPKSRRMRATWLMITLHYWLARYRPGSTVVFVSRKEGRNESEGSAELVWRAKFLHDHLPSHIPRGPGMIDYHFCRLEFPAVNSEILGIGQGADQLRQLTVTAIFGDECAFWENAAAFYAASKPTTEGGGRLTLVSSAAPGFFEQIVYDSL